jgi:hypothetical protein
MPSGFPDGASYTGGGRNSASEASVKPSVGPLGQITRCCVQPHLQKYFASLSTQITCVFLAIPFREGTLAIVTDVGAGSGGRGCAFDERRLMRTAKSCGPDAPMAGVKFARSSRFLGATVTNKSGLAGESTK